MFKDQVITIWMIIYDGEASDVYTTTKFEKMLASVESSIRGYLCEDSPAAESMYRQIVEKIKEAKEQPAIPIQIGALNICVYRWEIDNSNKIHDILGRCYDAITDQSLRDDIDSLFSISTLT